MAASRVFIKWEQNYIAIRPIQNIWLKTKDTESTERCKISFRKEIVENVDLHKLVLNKIMTTQEQCVKYDFLAPLKFVKTNHDIKKKLLEPFCSSVQYNKIRFFMKPSTQLQVY